jgi:predicted RNase H-like nuclease (RuvC/YqgF family)
MKPLPPLYIAVIAAGVLIISAATAATLWSNHKLRAAEKQAGALGERAKALEQKAAELESAAGEYKAKTEYLDAELSKIRSIARRQDEELQALDINTSNVRADAERARRIRAIATTTDELCRKLAELGHACD